MSGSLLPQGQGRLRLPEEERARSSQQSAGPSGCWPGCTGPGEHQARQHGASGRRMETLPVCVWTCSPGQDGASSLASRGPQRHLIGTVTAPRPLPPAAFRARQRRGPSGGPLPRTRTACTAVGPLRPLRMTCPPPAPALSPSTQRGGRGPWGHRSSLCPSAGDARSHTLGFRPGASSPRGTFVRIGRGHACRVCSHGHGQTRIRTPVRSR